MKPMISGYPLPKKNRKKHAFICSLVEELPSHLTAALY
jgi:hypothetical protein